MSLLVKIVVGVMGVLLIGGPLWPVGVFLFAYLALAFRPKNTSRVDSGKRRFGGRSRYILALALFAVSAMAYSYGGTLSPIVFSLGGFVALFWPWLVSFSLAGEVIPVEDSIAFRSKYFPFVWHALGELKPGSDPVPRALSSYSGTLLIFTDTGKAYALATCFALGRTAAEAELTERLRASAPRTRSGALPFPLDSGTACDVLRQNSTRISLPSEDLVKAAINTSGFLVLRCAKESVREAGAYESLGQGHSPKVPGRGQPLGSPPLLWEVLESVGKRTRWPDPDPYSSLLDSLNVTRGAPLCDRLKAIEGSGSEMSLQSLGGTEVRVTRPQLRALVAIYS
jgi:hypothetical protein